MKPLASLFALALMALPAGAQERVASIGSSVTEIVYLLGQQDRLVARDTTSTEPPEALALPDLGYLRALSAEGVLSLRPDLVLMSADSGPPEALAALETAGVPVVMVTDAPTVEGISERIRTVAGALSVPEAGAALVAQVEADLAAALAAADPGDGERPRVLFVLSSSGGRLTGAGDDTAAAAIIAMAGAQNAVTGFSGYKPLGDEAVAAAMPDLVLTMQAGGPRDAVAGTPDEFIHHPALAETPAGKAGRVVSLPGTFMLVFGPHTPQAVTALHDAIAQAMAQP